MTANQDANSTQMSGSRVEEELMFSHSDHTSELDALEDSTRQVADRFHAMGPVIRGHGSKGGTFVRFGDLEFPNILAPARMCEGEVFAAVSWEAHRLLYTNPTVFSSTLFEESVGAFWGPALTPMDPPEHTKYRLIMQRGFTPKYIKGYEDTIIRPVLSRRFNAFKHKGSTDLVREINVFYPYEIVGRIVGFEPGDVAFVSSCFSRIWQANVDIQVALKGAQDLRAYTAKLIAARRQSAREDLVSAMLQEEVDGMRLPDENLVGMVNHLMSGGIETTYRQTGVLMNCLLRYPEQFELVKRNRRLIPNAVEESLRYDGIGGIVCRRAIQDGELCGTQIPKGCVVFTFPGVANRDPTRWPNPHAFDLQRQVVSHMMFSAGPHSCIGQHLARFMLGRYLEHVIDDLPNVRWDPALKEIPKITGWTQRTSLTLPVVWDPPN
jgi:cytochrome P450